MLRSSTREALTRTWKASLNFELLSLYTSRGDGTLLGPVQFGAPMSGICASDFNNDGAIDLAGVKSAVGAGVLMNSNGTFVKLQVSPSNPLFGETVVLEVQVTASFRFSGTLSGSVGFYDNGTQSASSGLSSGMATVNTAALSKGKHTLTAHYSGNTNFNPHTSNPITITVQ